VRAIHFVLTLTIAAASTAGAADYESRVAAVQDGDTVTVLDSANREHRVRLAGIDAPEKNQTFGRRASRALSDYAFRRDVSDDGRKVDPHGRVVAKVLGDGTDCNLRQIELGLACHYKRYEGEQSDLGRSTYSQMETSAKLAQSACGRSQTRSRPGNIGAASGRWIRRQKSFSWTV
jgi:endonuclease YncB( thermonuclease family)